MDANVWIDHLHRREPALSRLVEASQVLMHQMVLGELACGTFKDRAERLRFWRALPQIDVRTHDDVIDWIDSERLGGAGIGFVDAHILRSVVANGDTALWTRDRSLRRLAARFGAAHDHANP
ncbi:type II toxin-antitoxin system VapC family toxin [Candidatus Palauibacter sp.]|uniref:type II toxin-antitoxin system VapC family toxin n=1 Tax=Candidatus Palauibacter sp. TaxID=3101350 RepID=UPI003AF2F4DF